MLALRLLYGFCYGFSIPLPSSLIGEIIPLKWRGKSLVLLNFFVTVGKLFGCLLAYLCLDSFDKGDWRKMMVISSIPSLLVFIGSIFIIKESPRYYLNTKEFTLAFESINAMIK